MATTADDGPVTSIPEAIARMEAITASNPERDGLRCFNHLYTEVTRTVWEWVNTDKFDDPEFLTVLDVAFANRYLDAIRAWDAGPPEKAPRVWRALLERRNDADIASIQFAVAGVNAHINLDLSISLVNTQKVLGVPLGTGSQRDDYEKVNDIFAALYRKLRDDFIDGKFEEIDQGRVARIIDSISHFAVDRTRDIAWENAEILIDVQDNRRLTRWVTETLDRTFGLAGRGLLTRGL